MSDSTFDDMSGQGEIILYPTADGGPRIECRLVDDSLWLTQRLMAELFDVKVPTINEHLANIYAERELKPEATIRKFLIVQQEGTREVSRQVEHYSLEAILAVGYRVRSPRGTAFRQWATERQGHSCRLGKMSTREHFFFASFAPSCGQLLGATS